MLKRLFASLKLWCVEAARNFRHEITIIFTDPAVMIFFFLLPLAYPVTYSLIYNTEVTREMPVAVVDNSRTALSREFTRHADATEAISIYGYAKDMEEARRWMAEKKVFCILEIPRDYARDLGRLEQPQVQFYCDMTLLLRYRTFISSITELQIATGAQLRQAALDPMGFPASGAPSQISNVGFALGDTQQGFASFIIPGIVVLIVQQSMLLGIVMIGGTRHEVRRRLLGPEPQSALSPRSLSRYWSTLEQDAQGASPSAQIVGRALAYTIIYMPAVIYVFHYVLSWFSYPHEGEVIMYFTFILPMLLASAMLGQTLNLIAHEREASFVIVVFTSVIFLFLSGLTWPRYAMNSIFTWMGDLVPATAGIDGFVRINSNGAPLGLQTSDWTHLWLLTLLYTVTAYFVCRHLTRTAR